jgi:hypothetical protein
MRHVAPNNELTKRSKMRLVQVLSCCLFLIAASCARQEQVKEGQGADNSPLEFVQSFYNWYVPLALELHPERPALELALERRSSSFAPALARALEADLKAAAAEPDYIVGIDFDPFLASQDPCERYEVGRIHRDGQTYLAEIHRVCEGERRTEPDIVAELVPGGGLWLFANFRYPDVRSDLLSELGSLRRSREEQP